LITRCISLVGLVAALGVLLVLPAFSAADFVGDAVSQVGSGGTPSAPSAPAAPVGGGQSSSPRSGLPPDYKPPQHGTSPHGQGTVGTIDINPSEDNPLGAETAGTPPTGNGEEIVVGRSRGQQNDDGSYHGHVTAVALFGSELFGADSTGDPTGTFGQLNDGLDQICGSGGSNGQLCIQLLAMNSSANSNSSTNRFQAASVHLGDGPVGNPPGTGTGNQINASAGASHGDISDDGSCQTASGDSNVAKADVGGDPGHGALSADALSSSSRAQGCSNGDSSHSNSSRAINVNNNGVPLPDPGCDLGTPNTNAAFNSPLLAVVCNADDSTSATVSRGTREALTVFILDVAPGMTLAKLTTAASESRAARNGPITPPGPSCTGSGCANTPGNRGNSSNNGNANDDNGNAASSARSGAGAGTLPFTGTTLLLMAMTALGLLGGGLAVKTALAGRRL
jgi:hypothetical protein